MPEKIYSNLSIRGRLTRRHPNRARMFVLAALSSSMMRVVWREDISRQGLGLPQGIFCLAEGIVGGARPGTPGPLRL
jgi:hypothetical protein